MGVVKQSGPHPAQVTQVIEWKDGDVVRLADWLTSEEPLEMRVGRHSIGVTLRTPGNDEELVAGFFFTEGIISRREELVGLRVGPQRNLVRVTLDPGVRLRPSAIARRFSAGSACGVCGKAAIGQIRAHGTRSPESATLFDPEILCQLPDRLRAAQTVFCRTGGLHAAALFNARGDLVALREDIGRHNAVDKVIGWALLEERLPLGGHALLVSGRGGFEIVQKAAIASIPLIASVSAPSSLAVQLAREQGMTLIGFLRDKRFVIYSGEKRISIQAPAAGPWESETHVVS